MRAGLIAAVFLLALLPARLSLAGPALLFDPSDGKVLYAEDQDAEWHPASLTKIMTAYLTFEALKQGKLKLEDRIPYSALAAEQTPSKLGLPIGAQLTIDSALKALIIKSANDVAVMLAEAIGGSQPGFVAIMNNTAQRLDMTRTNFVNPNGLPALQQVTTARDLAKLARAVVKDYPEYTRYWSMFDARIGNIRLSTHNGLLGSFQGADGMKTGFICDSGYNIVATATRDGRQLVAVVLGEQTGAERTVRAASLLEHGFQQYAWKQLFNPATIDTVPISTDVTAVTSIRETVRSGECGGRRIARRKGHRPRKPKPEESSAAATPPAIEAAPPANDAARPANDTAAKVAETDQSAPAAAAAASAVTAPATTPAAAGASPPTKEKPAKIASPAKQPAKRQAKTAKVPKDTP
ncbi:MAG: D-alanyl-D-alanine carboxypeptidase family protein [Hyphomicrobium sp.]|jgi:D-alanyl-D-alanine carboxypeptidase